MEAMAERDEGGRSALGVLAIGGGGLLVTQAVAAAVTKQSTHYSATTGDVLSDGLLAAGLLMALAGLEAARRTFAPRTVALAMAGQTAIVIAILATVAAGSEALNAVYVIGTVAWVAGLVGVAVASARSGDARWRPAIALPVVGLVALALADAGGAVLLGLIWLSLGVRVGRPRSSDL